MLSLIVPTFNSDKNIKKLIESIEAQIGDINFEVIFIDNLSSDNTKKIIDQSNIKNSSFYSKKDKGIYDAINYGVKKAINEWIWILGSDDVIFKNNIISKISKTINKIDKSFSGIYGTVVLKCNRKIFNSEYSIDDHFKKSLCQQSIVYRKESIIKAGYFENKYITTADYVLNMKLLKNNPNAFYYVDFPLAIFNFTGASFQKKDTFFVKKSLELRIENLGHHINLKSLIIAFFGRRGIVHYSLNNKINNSLKLIKLFFSIILHKAKNGK